MQLEKVFESINDRSFKLSCPSVRFVVAPGYHQVAFEGSGFLRCTLFGRFEYELLVKATHIDWIQTINHCIPHTDPLVHFQLQMTDQNGMDWQGGEWVRPKVENIFSAYQNEVFTVKGNVESVIAYPKEKLGQSETKKDHYEFIIPNAGIIPWQKFQTITTKNHENEELSWSRRPSYQTIEFDGCVINLQQLPETQHIRVTVRSEENTIPPFVDVKVLEALIFTTGRLLNFGALVRQSNNQNCIRLLAEHDHLQTMEFAPIQITEPEHFDDFWNIFKSVLEYLLKNDSENPFFHPLIEPLIPVLESSSKSTGIHSLTLAVAVETIVENAKLSSDPKSTDFCMSEIKQLKAYIQDNISDESLKNRFENFIGSVTSRKLSISDRLQTLIAKEVITEKQFKSWKALRNKSAHGGFIKITEDENFNEIFGDVITLVNTVILREAGYQGKITNYGGN